MKDPKGITVVGVEVSNFRRLTFAEVKMVPGMGLLRVTGRNGSGKTSLLRSIRAALGGAGEVEAGSVNDAAEGVGHVRLALSNGFTVTRRFTAANPKGYLTVEGPDGGRHTQTRIAEWLGPLSFDPLAFFDLEPKRQAEIVLALSGDPDLPGKLAAIRTRYRTVYDERTPWIAAKRHAAGVTKPAGDRPVPVDITATLNRMGELQRAERERQDAMREHERAMEAADRRHGDALREAREAADVAEEDLEDARGDLEIATEDRKVAERKLAAARDAEALAGQRVIDAEATLGAARAGATRAASAAPDYPVAPTLPDDPAPAMNAIRAEIADADARIRAAEPWVAWDNAVERVREADARIADLDGRMAALRDDEAALVATIAAPVPGLGFGEDGSLTLGDRALALASGAERIRVAVAIALAANPDLRVCLVDEANDMDLEGLEALDTLARLYGFQVWAARIGLEGPGEVVVADGLARDGAAAEAGAAT